MSLPRKDVRLRLDHDVHEILLILAGVDGLLPAEWVEREIKRVIEKRVHNARIIASEVSDLTSARNRVDKFPRAATDET